MAEDKARDRVESGDSGRERNAVIRPQGPDAAQMDFFNGLLGRTLQLFISISAYFSLMRTPNVLPERPARGLPSESSFIARKTTRGFLCIQQILRVGVFTQFPVRMVSEKE